ncbi:Rap1a/Tai family immunity protein [Polynucleobacter sp. AP-Latsch-80-C2]|jgi:hypothetical protein|uniref:Rap1a/Tai family immunity protein n=1 Tax=Polynucleobacter sp. AP-Latsch-80-C2 TaxID=2576931 RepID=UPI001C0E7231|nr:Rap1a/Tai family immunity protein [Polynucleobacter sp. AP-Latsch-80-C2]MBU3622222.1 hypothetical protein [Polynucleobacter sp. AP-Latsch-80-C2]
MNKITIHLASLLFCSGVVMAAPDGTRAISTQELAGVCGDQSSPQPQIYCDVYGQGVYDSYLVTRHPKKAPDFICVVQPAPSRREVMNQFIDWVKQNPGYNTAPAADTLLRFLAVRFSCESSSMSPGNAVNKIIR